MDVKMPRRIAAAILLFGLGLSATACSSGLIADIEGVKTLETQSAWRPHPENPIIKAGDFIDKGLWNDPHVLKEGGQYVMYLTSSSPENPFKPPIVPYRAISKDGQAWKLDPPGPLLDPSGTPFVSIETPSVVKFNGLYHMFYTGVYKAGGNRKFAIGHAVSNDGRTWRKDPKEALTPTGNVTDWNGLIVGEPGAVVMDNAIHVYFSAVGKVPGSTLPTSQSIGHVSTRDGVKFTAPQRVLELSSTYPESLGYFGYSTPMAVYEKGKLHLFFDVAMNAENLDPSWQQVALAHAVSTDHGQTFRQDHKPIFVRDNFDWTRGEIRSPSALFEDGTLHLWFAGMVPIQEFGPLIRNGIKGREFGIGHATIKSGLLVGAH